MSYPHSSDADNCGTARTTITQWPYAIHAQWSGEWEIEGARFDAAAPLKIVILGLSITSSWGNSHASTYRGLMRELSGLGHEVMFLERDVALHAANRDLPARLMARWDCIRALGN